MIDAHKTIEIYKTALKQLIDNGSINATYEESTKSVSFYINDIDNGNTSILTLRLSDHHPDLDNYVSNSKAKHKPWETENISVEFYVPKIEADGNPKRNRANPRVRIPYQLKNCARKFNVRIIEYAPRLLDQSDITPVYNAILSFVRGYGFKDPLAGTPKAAKIKDIESKLVFMPRDVCDAEYNFYRRYGLGDGVIRSGQIIEAKQREAGIIRLQQIINEEINRTINEGWKNWAVAGALGAASLLGSPQLANAQNPVVNDINTQKEIVGEQIDRLMLNSNDSIKKNYAKIDSLMSMHKELKYTLNPQHYC